MSASSLSFPAKAEPVVAHARAFIKGMHAEGILTSLKHFPGHGDTSIDSHTSLPIINHSAEQWATVDKPPFAAAIGAATWE